MWYLNHTPEGCVNAKCNLARNQDVPALGNVGDIGLLSGDILYVSRFELIFCSSVEHHRDDQVAIDILVELKRLTFGGLCLLHQLVHFPNQVRLHSDHLLKPFVLQPLAFGLQLSTSISITRTSLFVFMNDGFFTCQI